MAATKQDWISPSAAMDMVYDDPMGKMDGFGFALLRPRAKDKANSVADLARAKLQPRCPDDRKSATGAWPVTASDWRLVLAPGTPDVTGGIERWLADYDAAIHSRQKLLAAVLTFRFSADMMLHDMMSVANAYAERKLARERRLSSLLVLHAPGDELSARDPHVHALVLARTHRPCGWGAPHPDLTEEAQLLFHDEWTAFRADWEKGETAR